MYKTNAKPMFTPHKAVNPYTPMSLANPMSIKDKYPMSQCTTPVNHA